jgi:hypothetical protein
LLAKMLEQKALKQKLLAEWSYRHSFEQV